MTWYKEFSDFHDKRIRADKPPRHHVIKIIYFIQVCVFAGFFILAIRSILSGSRQPSYRTSPKYRKVIKEGILFDTIEYHEK